MKKIKLFLLCCLALTQCKVLFWKDTKQWLPGSWQGEERFYEIRLDYQTKLPWYPLSQNYLTRDYKATLLQHSYRANSQTFATKVVGSFNGWVMNDSIYANDKRIVLLRGLSDTFGKMDSREVLYIADTSQFATSQKVLFGPKQLAAQSDKPKTYLIAAIPSPDFSKLVVLHSNVAQNPRPGDIYVDIVSFDDSRILMQDKFVFAGAPGVPLATWDKQGETFYISQDKKVFQWEGQQNKLVEAQRFPKCFYYRGDTRISSQGKTFLRQKAQAKPSFQQASADYQDVSTQYIQDVGKIGQNCN
ncbi:MAG: hypothetical protein AAF518_04405 [Spirochaetota bacterium]